MLIRSILDDALFSAEKRASALAPYAGPVGNSGSGMVIPGLTSASNQLSLAPGQTPWHLREQAQHFKGWVFSAIRPIANRIAGQQIRVARLIKNPSSKSGQIKESAIPWHKRATLPASMKHFEVEHGAEMLATHPLLDALDDPNSIMVRWAVLYVTVVSLEMTGKAFWWVKKKVGETGRKKNVSSWEIWPVPSSWLTPIHGNDKLYTGWEIRPDGSTEPVTVGPDEIVYFYYPDFTNPLGAFSTIQALAPSIASDEAIIEAQRRGFQNGIHPGVLLTVGRHPDVMNNPGQRPILTQAQRAQLIHYIKSFYRGVARWDEPMILDGMIEAVTKMSFSPQEMDYQNSGKTTKERITQGFGVSPVIMGNMENSNRATSLVADEMFVNSTINPKICLLSECMTAWLGPLFSTKNERLLVYIDPATTHDAELDLKKAMALFDRGCVDVNWMRANLMNLPPQPGGNVTFVSRQLMPVEIKDNLPEGAPNPYIEAYANAGPAPAPTPASSNRGENVNQPIDPTKPTVEGATAND